jgi:hypothetical protein
MKQPTIDQRGPTERAKRLCKGKLANGKPCHREKIRGQRLCAKCLDRALAGK